MWQSEIISNAKEKRIHVSFVVLEWGRFAVVDYFFTAFIFLSSVCFPSHLLSFMVAGPVLYVSLNLLAMVLDGEQSEAECFVGDRRRNDRT